MSSPDEKLYWFDVVAIATIVVTFGYFLFR
jgi:hypothetical protein